MTAGFDHFDGSRRETFAAALLLLCLEEDPCFRDLFASIIREKAQIPGAEALIDWGREAHLDTGQKKKRARSDLWLKFAKGAVLVEIKTHTRWTPAKVERQMIAQRGSRLHREPVREAVLLAPGPLLRRVVVPDCPKLPWQEILRAVDGIENPSQIVRLSSAHWSGDVARDYGLPASFNPLSFDTAAAYIGCIVAFLHAAIERVGGKPDLETVWFASPDGRPKRHRGWAWQGTAVPGRIPGVGDVYFGVYTYSEAPPGEAPGTFLEAYRGPGGNDDVPLVSIPFSPPDLSSQSLDAILERFVAAFSKTLGSIPGQTA